MLTSSVCSASELISASNRKAQQLQKDGLLPDRVAKELAPKTPICVNCGSTNTELIKWTDKETGEPKQAWKCQDCKQWLPRNRKA